MGAGVSFGNILAHFKDIQVRGLPWGYFQERTKSILVVAPRNVVRDNEFLRGMGIMLVTGSRNLGSFIGDRDTDTKWLNKKLQWWEELVRTISGVPVITRCQLILFCVVVVFYFRNCL